AERYRNGQIVVAVEYALAVSPVATDVSVSIVPHLRDVAVGDVFTVSLRVDASASPVDQVYASLGFNPQYLTVVNAQGQPTNQITPNPLFTTIISNTVDNTNGYIDFATGQRATPLQQGFSVAAIRFKAKAQTAGAGTPIQFLQRPGHVTALYNHGVPVPASYTGGQVMIAASPATLNGSVTLQGRPAAPHNSWIGPLNVTLHQPGSSVAQLTYAVQTDNRGRFTIANIPAGTYDIRVKGPHTLANIRSNVALNTGNNSVNMGTLLEGDANNDNQVSVADASILASTFGLSQGNANFKPEADFNNDGIVNAADQQLLQANFGKTGDQVVSSGRATGASWMQALLAGESAHSVSAAVAVAGSSVTLLLQPAETSVNAGQVCRIDVMIRAGSQRVDSAEVHIPFDRNRLQVVNVQGNPVTQITPGTALPNVLMNRANNNAGLISFAAMTTSASPPSGDILLATFYLKAIGPAPQGTYLTFTLQGNYRS
ncbi:MAG: hypothetical protein H5T63_00500, partial [Chloroflexi bacterium]|nr:hypothetical protein [Chloroflexota bacterium]